MWINQIQIRYMKKESMKRENVINKKISLTIISISALIILIQFIDSYCTEIFGRTQSLSVTTFLIDASGMSADEGVAYMSRMMLPFYLIGMLTPFVRSYADIVGRKVMLQGCDNIPLIDAELRKWEIDQQRIVNFSYFTYEFRNKGLFHDFSIHSASGSDQCIFIHELEQIP